MEQILTREFPQNLFDTNSTYKEIIEILGLSPHSGGGYRTLKGYITQYQIDLNKYTQLNKQFKIDNNNIFKKRTQKYNLDNIFCKSNTKKNNNTLKQFLFENYLLPKQCVCCGIIDTYNNKPITLQLDHIDGDNLNNELNNLRLLCPNCHSQTDNFGSKNKKYKKTLNRHNRPRKEYWSFKNGEMVEKNRHLVDMVITSDIDFSKYGWSGQVAKLLNKPPQKIAKWMRKYMCDFYESKCFKRSVKT